MDHESLLVEMDNQASYSDKTVKDIDHNVQTPLVPKIICYQHKESHSSQVSANMLLKYPCLTN